MARLADGGAGGAEVERGDVFRAARDDGRDGVDISRVVGSKCEMLRSWVSGRCSR